MLDHNPPISKGRLIAVTVTKHPSYNYIEWEIFVQVLTVMLL